MARLPNKVNGIAKSSRADTVNHMALTSTVSNWTQDEVIQHWSGRICVTGTADHRVRYGLAAEVPPFLVSRPL
ncbi:hypothetical protein ABIF70_001008 [Bradyrhizobium japonicum]